MPYHDPQILLLSDELQLDELLATECMLAAKDEVCRS